jgi:hypothetical protein
VWVEDIVHAGTVEGVDDDAVAIGVVGIRRGAALGQYVVCARPSWCDPAGESPAQVRPKRAAW